MTGGEIKLEIRVLGAVFLCISRGCLKNVVYTKLKILIKRWNRAKRLGGKHRFFSKGIDFMASLPFDQAWSRAYPGIKKLVPCNQSPPTLRKVLLKVLKMADFVWGFWSL